MRVIVLGANGMLGAYVSSYLREIYAEIITPTKDEFDIINQVTSSNFGHDLHLKPGDIVINCAGIINKREDKILQGGETLFLRESIMVNSIFPQIMALYCRAHGARFIHVSTDCVFDGVKGNYDIDDKHNSQDIYGVSKSCGEPNSETCILIRTSIIGESKNGRSLLEWLKTKTGQMITGYDNHKWNGITCLELAKQIHSILEQGKANGMFVITSPDSVTKYELCKKLTEEYNLNINVVKGKDIKDLDRTLVGNIVSSKTICEQIKEMVEYKILA